MKKWLCLALLIVMLAGLFPAGAGADEVAFYLTETPFHEGRIFFAYTEWKMFAVKPPAYPAVTEADGGIRVEGLTAWGVNETQMTAWTYDGRKWKQDKKNKTGDGVLITITAFPKDKQGNTQPVQLELKRGKMAPKSISIRIEPDEDGEKTLQERIRIGIPCASTETAYYGSEGEKEFSVRSQKCEADLQYDPSGRLTEGRLYIKKTKREYEIQYQKENQEEIRYTVLVTRDGEPVAERMTVTDLPIELVGLDMKYISVQILNRPPNLGPDIERADIKGAFEYVRKPEVWKEWPLAGFLPEKLPEVTCEQQKDGTVLWTIRDLYVWGGEWDYLGKTYRAQEITTEEDAAPYCQIDEVEKAKTPDGEIRVISDFEDGGFEDLWIFGDTEGCPVIILHGYIEKDEKTGMNKDWGIYMELLSDWGIEADRLRFSFGTGDWAGYDIRSEDRLSIQSSYCDGLLTEYSVYRYLSNDEEYFYRWTVGFDDSQTADTGRLTEIFAIVDGTPSGFHFYAFDSEQNRWTAKDENWNDIPTEEGPPQELLDACPLMKVN